MVDVCLWMAKKKAGDNSCEACPMPILPIAYGNGTSSPPPSPFRLSAFSHYGNESGHGRLKKSAGGSSCNRALVINASTKEWTIQGKAYLANSSNVGQRSK
jgi:hypothetical protein